MPQKYIIMFAIIFAIITSFIYPQEKVHVVTDREFYLSGDTVWMHALLVDDIDTTIVRGRSRYLYVELRDLKDSLKNRVKLRASLTRVPPRPVGDETPARNMSLFSGYMPLPNNLEGGDYTIAAYTTYMAGLTELCYFKKRVHILMPQDVAYGFVPRVVMEPDFIPVRQDTVVSLPSSGDPLPSLQSLTGLSRKPQVLVASLNDNKFVPAARTEPYIDKALPEIQDIYSQEFIEAVGGVIVPRNVIEVGQVVSGTVYGNWKTHTPQSGVKVDMFSADESGFFDTQVTDSLGHFEFKGFEFANGAKMTISARRQKRKSMLDNIKIDEPDLPKRIRHKPIYKRYFASRSEYEHVTNLSDDAVMCADALMQQAQTSDVFKSYMLNEVDVKSERKIKVKGAYSNLASRSIDGEQLEKDGVMNLRDAILRLPGVVIMNGTIWWRQLPVALYIDMVPEIGTPAFEGDDFGYCYESSLDIPISIIGRVDFLNESSAALMGGGSMRGTPAIAVTFRMGASHPDANISHCTIHQPFGHQMMSYFTPNQSSQMFVAEMDMFLDAAETKWQQALRNLAPGSVHTLTIEGLDATGAPFSRVVTIND